MNKELIDLQRGSKATCAVIKNSDLLPIDEQNKYFSLIKDREFIGYTLPDNITFLTSEQIFGDKKLDILKKYGESCAITDFSILLGGYVNNDYHTKEGNTDKDRTGWWWTRTYDGDNDARIVSTYGLSDFNYVRNRSGGARPALPYS